MADFYDNPAVIALGPQAANVITQLQQVDPNYDWTPYILQAADYLNQQYPDKGWQDPSRGTPAGIANIILSSAKNDPAMSSKASSALSAIQNQQQQQADAIQAEQATHGEKGLGTLGNMALSAAGAYFGAPFLGSALGIGSTAAGALAGGLTSGLTGGNPLIGAASGGLGGYFGGAESALPAGKGGIDSGSLSQILGNGAYGPGGAFAPGMVDVIGSAESAMANTAAQTPATSYPVSTPPTLQDLNATDITNSVPPQGYSNLAGETGTFDPTTPQPMPETPNMGNSMIDPNELAAGNPPVQLTNEAGQALTAGAAATGAAATASGVGATQAAGAGLTAAQLLSGASTAVGAGSLLSNFMDSVNNNPLMKALQTGQGIAGIISGLTSTQGMISPEQARAMADPFASSRQQYIDQLNALMANPSLTTSTPGYQFNLQQGLAGVQARQAKAGSAGTAAGDIGVQQFGQQAAMSSFDQQVANLSKLSGAGQSPSAGANAALTAQGQQVSQRNAGMQAIGQGIGAIGQAQSGGQPGGYSMPNGWGITDQNVNSNYTQGFDPASASMQPMGGYIADPTTGKAQPQNLLGA